LFRHLPGGFTSDSARRCMWERSAEGDEPAVRPGRAHPAEEWAWRHVRRTRSEGSGHRAALVLRYVDQAGRPRRHSCPPLESEAGRRRPTGPGVMAPTAVRKSCSSTSTRALLPSHAIPALVARLTEQRHSKLLIKLRRGPSLSRFGSPLAGLWA